MKYRHVELYYQKALDDVGTWINELKTTDPISAIRLAFFGLNSTTSNKENFLNDVITKIEIVDGSDTIFSMTLKEAQALQFRQTGKLPYIRPCEVKDVQQQEQVMLLFGRHLWDPEYYLDLTKFKNPQIKITTNIAAVRAAGVTGFVASSLKVSVDLSVIEEGAEPAKGFMMAKNIRGFTSATSGDEPTPLPIDYPYVGLLLRAFVAGNDVNENITRLKIDCDVGKFVPLNKYVMDLYRYEEETFGPALIHYLLFRANAETVVHFLNHDPVAIFTPYIAGRSATAPWSWSSRFFFNLYDGSGAAVTSEENTHVAIHGSCPHSTIHVPFGLRENPDTYFDPTLYNDIDLILTQGAASAVSIILEQLRPY